MQAETMQVRRLAIPEVIEIIPEKFTDARGFFSETYSREKLAQAGIAIDFVQDNHSLSMAKGVLRGLHYQTPPVAQDKLVRVVKGAIFDVAADLRRGSPTFGKWVSLIVSAAAWNQILVPKGFAHGFVTLEPRTEVVYKVSAPYSQAHDRVVRYDDPDLAIDWPGDGFILSEKDRAAPQLKESEPGFSYDDGRGMP